MAAFICMVCLMDDARIRFTFIISKLLFTIVMAEPLLCSGLPRLLVSQSETEAVVFREKVCCFAPIIISILFGVHFHTLLVTSVYEEDDSFIQPCLDCNG